jgi:hypothetical protein
LTGCARESTATRPLAAQAPPPPGTPPPARRDPFAPALAAYVLPLAAFAFAWLIAGRIPLAVSTREWGTWFFIGPLMGAGGLAGFALALSALARGSRAAAVGALVLNAVLVLIAWAGLFG